MNRVKKLIKAIFPKRLRDALLPLYHLFEAVFWHALAGFPGRGLRVIGVTGTNGKTTTTYLIHRMLLEAGYKPGLMTTVAYSVGADIRAQMHHMTNVPIREFARRLKLMRRQGMDWLVLEATSHALAQHRVWGVSFSVAVITNVTHEHLEFHGTFENYREAKRQLFARTNRHKNGLRTGIVNRDDPSWQVFADSVAHPISYGVHETADLQAQNIQLSSSGVAYDVLVDDEIIHITTNLPGSFNVANSLAAIGVGQALELTGTQIAAGIAALEGVEGRMTRIDEGQPYSVIVDFAHTPDSFEKLFEDLRPIVKGKLIVVFGSPGCRDTAKRAAQGSIAGKYADIVVLTEEDDRDEDGHTILDQIAGGAEAAGKIRGQNLHLLLDRTEAIQFALQQASSKEDTVLLLGKGHEKTIERADGEHPWNEIETARNAIASKVKK